ncbi:NfeD family protein [Paramaledivibacter caminithermalis]|jgi:membrane protein implicated in regulation of membrane protease activity|uniref:Membrane protein implicated in regulation of membrane protease activity n=1 Tax=Paramaledivibacter caminithermalis (strain DSM 15212 / CIP 107654 / DViRD3) TaxID=1121301 RepID=A0A1M6RPB4_PARC5|nr:NfeD family protein [Paramaledivibacter caminithermalis]SHK34230.1 Membrane protein implicated in regulation of membrane protease activity [Paramaledivibacter caminithermalis DSM 15212]
MWIVIAVLFVIIEAFTLGLTTIWFALGALSAMLVAMIDVGIVGQIFVFLIASGVFVYFTRPIAKKYLKIGTTKTNVNSVVGLVGIVTKEIEPFNTGQVKVAGQIWTAKAYDNKEIEKNIKVEVIKVEGVKLIVKRKQEK